MDKRYIATIFPSNKGKLRITVVDHKQFKTVLDYKTHSKFKEEALRSLAAMYGEGIMFIDKTVSAERRNNA